MLAIEVRKIMNSSFDREQRSRSLMNYFDGNSDLDIYWKMGKYGQEVI